MADALVSGASDLQKSCGFNSHLLHQVKGCHSVTVAVGSPKTLFLGCQWQTRWFQVPVTFKSRVGSTPISCTKRKTALLFLNLAKARFLKHYRLFFASRDQTQLALHWRVGRDLIRFGINFFDIMMGLLFPYTEQLVFFA